MWQIKATTTTTNFPCDSSCNQGLAPETATAAGDPVDYSCGRWNCALPQTSASWGADWLLGPTGLCPPNRERSFRDLPLKGGGTVRHLLEPSLHALSGTTSSLPLALSHFPFLCFILLPAVPSWQNPREDILYICLNKIIQKYLALHEILIQHNTIQ